MRTPVRRYQMNSKFHIFTDSCCNLPYNMIKSFGLKVLPLTFNIEGKQYHSFLEGQEVDLKQFYYMMRNGKEVTTSLPNLHDAKVAFEKVLVAGKDVLYLGFSSGLSGTYESMNLILEDLKQAYPDRKIYAVDTLAAALGEGMLVYYAATMADNGASIDEVWEWVENNKLRAAHWFTVDDLMFLFRGGRVTRTAALAGTLLNIKPVMHVDDEGHLIPLAKVRSRKKSLAALVDHMKQTVTQPTEDQVIFINHADCIEDAEFVEKLVRENFQVKDVVINILDPVIGAHSGPGTVALFYMGSER